MNADNNGFNQNPARSFEHNDDHNQNQSVKQSNSRQPTNLTESSHIRENFIGGVIDSNQAQQSQMNQVVGARAATNNTPLVSESGFFNGGADGISPAASSLRDTKSNNMDEIAS